MHPAQGEQPSCLERVKIPTLPCKTLPKNTNNTQTLSLLASFYNRSTKAVNELRDAQGAMGTAGVKVKKIYEVRWNSIYESLVAVLREYPAILHNLTAVDPAGPLLAAVSRAEMLLGSYALMPALESLQALLKVLQRRGLFLGDVPPAIDSIISHLARMYIAPQTKFRTSEFLGRNGSGIGSGGDATAAGEAGSGCGSGGDAAAASEAGSSGARSSKSRTITICSWHDLATAADGAPLCFVDLPERPERLLRGAVVDERPQPPELHYRHEVDGQPALLVPTTAVPPSDGQPGRPHCRARGVDVELLGAVNSRPAQ